MIKNRVPVAKDYTVEYHPVVTSDGYILGLYRFSGSPSSPPAAGKKVVLLMHGVFSSWADWVVLGPGKAFSYLLADAGL